MVEIQSLKIGASLVAFVIALSTVNTLAAGVGVGVQLDASGVSTSEVETLNDDLQNPTVAGIGQQDPGFLGVAVGIKRTLEQLYAITTRTHLILGAYGVPTVIGAGVQVMVNFTMAIGSLQILGRFKF
jgi:hypothetical protein